MVLKDSLLSLSNVVIEFGLEDKRFRSVRPKVDLSFLDTSLKCQWFFQSYLMSKQADLVSRVKSQTETYEIYKDLKIHVDPWDHYLVFDSDYFLQFLINSRSFAPEEQMVQVHFVVRSVEEDVISHFHEDPDLVIDKYFEFIKELKEFNETNIFEWLQFLKENNLTDVKNEHIMDNLNRLFHLFFQDQKDKGCLLKYKKDYID